MEWLNYHHLLYFWMVAREGSVTRAGAQLRLAQPTISGQIRALEGALGEPLFTRSGRTLVLTDFGQTVYRYADEIFSLGRELLEAVKGRPTGRPVKLVVGVADVIPKLVACRLLSPALELPEHIQLICREDSSERLLAELATNNLDLVLTDAPIPPTVRVRAFNHLLGECSVCIVGTPKLAARYRKRFPRSLDGAPFLLPTQDTTLRRSLDHWFEAQGIHPRMTGEFKDNALLKAFGHAGAGLFAIPDLTEKVVRRQYGVSVVGRVASVREQFYAISLERKVKNPAVVAITTAAQKMFVR